ncbi:MAG TPA: DUF4388 domain-containing protein [Ktedonobacteraceae bacterium]
MANVIQVLQLGQKTGKLIAERNVNSTFEHGLITFVQGQITQASANRQHGSDALKWLQSWEHCRFTFVTEQKSGRPEVSQQAPTTVTIPTTGYFVPRPTRSPADGILLIERLGLSRTHRHVFLLIDGRRSIKELTRLIRHESRDVLKLLRDLERAGVIQI